jgi:hypothetical protein
MHACLIILLVHLHVQCPYVSYVLQKNHPFLLVFRISLILLAKRLQFYLDVYVCAVLHICVRVTVALLWHLSRDRFVAFRVGLNLR